jgi:hypothetical protein
VKNLIYILLIVRDVNQNVDERPSISEKVSDTHTQFADRVDEYAAKIEVVA